jgi:hypothetical protein
MNTLPLSWLLLINWRKIVYLFLFFYILKFKNSTNNVDYFFCQDLGVFDNDEDLSDCINNWFELYADRRRCRAAHIKPRVFIIYLFKFFINSKNKTFLSSSSS